MNHQDSRHRYELLAEALKITVNKLATDIDVPPSTISKAIARKSAVTEDVEKKIFAKYPNLSADWWVKGVGEPFPVANQNKETEKAEWIRDENFKLPTKEELERNLAETQGGQVNEKDVAYAAVKRMQKVLFEIPLPVVLSHFDTQITSLNARVSNLEKLLGMAKG